MTELDDLVPQMKVLVNGTNPLPAMSIPTFIEILLDQLDKSPIMGETARRIRGMAPYEQAVEACRVFNAINNFGDKEDDVFAVLDDLAVLQEKARRDKDLLAAGKPTLRVSLGEFLKRKAG